MDKILIFEGEEFMKKIANKIACAIEAARAGEAGRGFSVV